MDLADVKRIQYEWNADAMPRCTVLIDGEPLNCTDFALSQHGARRPDIAIGCGGEPFRIVTMPAVDSQKLNTR